MEDKQNQSGLSESEKALDNLIAKICAYTL